MTMPAGEYYVGDLCYVMSDRWDEFCNITISGNECMNGEFTLSDGVRFASYGTAHGDGLYEDNFGNEYPVDAGLIGCILVSDIAESELKGLKYGHIKIFTEPFMTGYLDPQEGRPGKIFFGSNLVIDTDPEYVEDDFYDEEEEL